MKILLIQPDIIWESPLKNIEKYNKLIDSALSDPELILLPEMFTTGFSMNTEKLALPANNDIINWMKDKAKLLNTTIAGSLIINDQGSFYNRLYFVNSKGIIEYYDKRHMFRMGGEGEYYRAGFRRPVFSLNGWRILGLVCYDLRFPVWSRNREEYDLLIYVANWPAARSDVWNTLLRARAIENQSWVIGLNRVGIDGEEIEYIGESQVIDPKGMVINKLEDREKILETEISLDELNKFRKKFPAWKDRDKFNSDW